MLNPIINHFGQTIMVPYFDKTNQSKHLGTKYNHWTLNIDHIVAVEYFKASFTLNKQEGASKLLQKINTTPKLCTLDYIHLVQEMDWIFLFGKWLYCKSYFHFYYAIKLKTMINDNLILLHDELKENALC